MFSPDRTVSLVSLSPSVHALLSFLFLPNTRDCSGDTACLSSSRPPFVSIYLHSQSIFVTAAACAQIQSEMNRASQADGRITGQKDELESKRLIPRSLRIRLLVKKTTAFLRGVRGLCPYGVVFRG